ncbi:MULTISPECIES: type IV-A pilus assembly ATPase PilB [Thioalkalivibrio]|uniref:Type IV-A pilus assembly ATPase PilB n=1 Tax=Thioalkalivibrio halophilus TaxID=252474 RepID=A0A1V2ZVN1_9GAMM|nr:MULTISPECIES: type IV-A pilus assembly ATPase PilB [Thioalkalivibrio]OOC09159.1 type IV-A pilus assembly ATPase PilB [Thioalkalivibrio halophilus]PYG03083.1 type IV pilus assembly protein PilB [Thioalkalivibrio sp. ALE21]
MANSNTTPRLPGLAKRLVDNGLIAQDIAQQLVEQARTQQTPLMALLADKGDVPEPRLVEAAAEEFGLPVLDMAAFDEEVIPRDHLNEKLIQKHHALPLMQRGNRLFIAVSDPTNLVATDEFKFATGMPVDAVLVEPKKLDKAIDDALNASSQLMEDLGDDELDSLNVEADSDTESASDEGDAVDDAPVVRFVNKLLMDAINRKASDIHLEPFEKDFRVRFRIDGVLHEVAHPPNSLAPRILARVKVMSRMDIAERRIPQDGRIKLKLSRTRAIDFRVSSLPTLFGEKIVLRILDPSSASMGIDQLGYEEEQKAQYLEALGRPYGMILVTGPTGSGKTVSLYTGLGILNTSDRNISTAEDPSEINMPGVNQVNINPKVGLTFASALRAFLRQDPDVIMVGEIRDLETAEIAIKAAQTGHLVLSTLHTNDAPQTLTRLANMGVPPYNIASSILLIIAQRLARRLCPNCKAPEDLPEETLRDEGFTDEELEQGFTVYRPVGCDQCTNGYKGRLGIYQVMPISEELERIILENGNSTELARQAEKEGIKDLRRAGLHKVIEGLTSLEEVNRVTID